MKIKLKLPDSDFQDFDADPGSTLEDIYISVKDKTRYTCVAAKVNNRYQSLTGTLGRIVFPEGQEAAEGSESIEQSIPSVELLDVRNPGASRIYQAGISMVFLAAAKKVAGDAGFILANTLARGIYIEPKGDLCATDEMAGRIRSEMQSIVDRDVPVRKISLPRDEVVQKLTKAGDREKLSIVNSQPELDGLDIYDLDGYSEFFYPVMVPSAGYVRIFSLERYRRGLLLRFPNQYIPDGIPEFTDEPCLFRTFEEQSEWDRLLGVDYVADLNEKIESGGSMELIQLSEALHDKKLTEIANMITAQDRRLVLIAGPSSSGKTTFAKRLCIHLRVNGCKTLYMGTDDYFIDRDELVPDENGELDYENLDALDTGLFNDNMRDLLEGKEVDLPEFDFLEGKKKFGRRVTRIDDNTVLVIEGIHALNEVLTSRISKEDKFKVYISPLTSLNIDAHNRVPTTDERLLRRIVRDDRTRGRGAAQTIADWPKVRRGEDRNIFRYNSEADVMFNSYHVYEISVLKKYVEPLLKVIPRSVPEYAEARRLLDILRFFRGIDDDSPVVNDSILREFIGGSIYVS